MYKGNVLVCVCVYVHVHLFRCVCMHVCYSRAPDPNTHLRVVRGSGNIMYNELF